MVGPEHCDGCHFKPASPSPMFFSFRDSIAVVFVGSRDQRIITQLLHQKAVVKCTWKHSHCTHFYCNCCLIVIFGSCILVESLTVWPSARECHGSSLVLLLLLLLLLPVDAICAVVKLEVTTGRREGPAGKSAQWWNGKSSTTSNF